MKKILTGLIVVFVGLGMVLTPSVSFLISKDNGPDEMGEISEKEKDIPKKDKKNTIKANIDINPKKLNCKSKGNWITAYISLPNPYNVQDIVIDSILLDGTIQSETNPQAIVDISDDNVSELMVKFDRSVLIEYLNLEPQQLYKITITGKLGDGTKFKGSCVIELKHYSS